MNGANVGEQLAAAALRPDLLELELAERVSMAALRAQYGRHA